MPRRDSNVLFAPDICEGISVLHMQQYTRSAGCQDCRNCINTSLCILHHTACRDCKQMQHMLL